MKAKEYFEKYGAQLVLDENTHKIERMNAIIALFLELCCEAETIGEQRKVKRIEAVVSIVKEMNDKWNTVGDLCKKHYGVDPLVENGFKEFVLDQTPELRMVWK